MRFTKGFRDVCSNPPIGKQEILPAGSEEHKLTGDSHLTMTGATGVNLPIASPGLFQIIPIENEIFASFSLEEHG